MLKVLVGICFQRGAQGRSGKDCPLRGGRNSFDVARNKCGKWGHRAAARPKTVAEVSRSEEETSSEEQPTYAEMIGRIQICAVDISEDQTSSNRFAALAEVDEQQS